MLWYNEQEYALGNMQVFHEFDTKSFQANAASYLKGEYKDLNFKTSYYSKTIADTVQGLKDITLDKEAVREFAKISIVNTTLAPIRPIDYSDVTVININFLTDYVEKIKSLVDAKIEGKPINKDDVVATGYIKKNIVKTTLDYRKPLNDLITGNDTVKKIIPDKKYITSTVIPFVNGFEKTRATLSQEGKDILLVITTTEDDINKIIMTVNKAPSNDTKVLEYIEYNGIYNIIDIMSYVTYMYVRKVNNFRTNVLNCNRLYTDIINGNNLSVNEYTTVNTGMNTGVMSTTPANLGFAMLQGNVGAYEILANKVYELYAGKNKVDDMDDVVRLGDDIPDHIDGQYTQGTVKYNRDVYDNIKKVLIGIGQGLYNICQIPDGLMIRRDDVIGNSGFKLALKDRFRSKLDDIGDIAKIQHADIANNGKIDLANIDELLSEVKDYAKNMKEIADEAVDAYAIVDEIKGRFTHNINNEFKDVDSVKELEEWINMFDDEYREFINDIAGRFMERLAYLAITMKNIDNNITPIGQPSDVVKQAFNALDVTDYVTLGTESVLDYTSYENHLEFELLEKAYQTLRIFQNTGYTLMFEEDEVEKPTDKAKFTANFTVNAGNAIEKLKAMISKWFEKISAAFSENITKLGNSDAVKNILDNSNNILAIDYNTIPAVEIYPYNNIAPGTVVDNLNKLRNNIKAMNPQVIQNINSETDLYSKLFPFIDGFNSTGDLSTQCLWFNKTGNAEASQVKSYQGDELKGFIQNDMLPFVKDYTTTYGNTIKSTISQIKDDLESTVSQYKTTPAPQQGTPQTTAESALFEADDPNKNTQTSMGKKAGWMNKAVQIYTGNVLNAMRDRYNDYVKILGRLAAYQPEANTGNENQTTI